MKDFSRTPTHEYIHRFVYKKITKLTDPIWFLFSSNDLRIWISVDLSSKGSYVRHCLLDESLVVPETIIWSGKDGANNINRIGIKIVLVLRHLLPHMEPVYHLISSHPHLLQEKNKFIAVYTPHKFLFYLYLLFVERGNKCATWLSFFWFTKFFCICLYFPYFLRYLEKETTFPFYIDYKNTF